MLDNCDQMVTIIPPTTNQWPHPHQNQIDDHKVSSGRASSMDQKPANQEQQQQQQQALKCPRCDSSNTKFCYYNNYSLSQPRHFCKACKRYWTRGGTLRNVPVGGGCRRNKRTLMKRSTDTSSPSSVSTNSTTLNNVSQPHIENTPSSSMFHGLSSNSYNLSDVNLPFSRLFNYDLQPQVNNNANGLGFSSSGFMSNETNGYRNGFTSYGSIFRSSSTSASTSVLPSMLNSNLLQQKLMNHGSTFKDGSNTFQGLEQMQTGISNGNSEAALKDQIEHVGLYDPSLYWNNTSSHMGLWNDQSNLGPSVTSFI